jgi:hypothetical protein
MHEVVQLERQGWQALTSQTAREHFDRILTEDAFMVVPGGLLDRVQVLLSWERTVPWLEYRLDDERVVEIGPGVALLVYRASARRSGQSDPYRAVMSSLYVGGDGAWRLAFHQQTPL